MMNARIALAVDQTIVQITLAFILNLIAVMPQLLEMNIFVHLEYLVKKMKEIVILMLSVRLVLLVDQTTVLLHLVLTLKLIVVIQMIIQSMILVGCLV